MVLIGTYDALLNAPLNTRTFWWSICVITIMMSLPRRDMQGDIH